MLPGWSSFGGAFDLLEAGCEFGSFLDCFDARSASWRARRSAFSSALLLAGFSVGVLDSATGTLTGAPDGATRSQHHKHCL